MTYWGSSFRKIGEKELDRAGEFILQLACLVTVLHGIVSHGKMITFYSILMVPSTCFFSNLSRALLSAADQTSKTFATAQGSEYTFTSCFSR